MKSFLDNLGLDILAFTSMFDFIKDLIFLMEVDEKSFQYIYVNQSAIDVLNIDEAIIGNRIEEILSKGLAEVLIPKYQEAQSTKKTVDFIEILDTENGEFIGEASLNPILTENGQCKYILAIVRDVTERKREERELQETKRNLETNQKRLISLVEHNGDAVYEMDLEGNFININKTFTEIIGYDENEMIGTSFLPLIIEEKKEVTISHFMNALKGSKEEYETCIRNKSGQLIQLLVKNVPIIVDEDIVGIYGIASDISERKRIREELAKMAFYDYLTGLPNRRTFDERFNMAILQAKRSKKKVAVMMIDGRKFKQINDTYGHDAGDEVLKEMSKRLKASVRQTDTVARLGGDEMGIILPEIDSVEMAEVVAKRIVASFDETFHFQDFEIKIGAGIGIAFYPDHSVNKKQLIKYADEALYEAKKSNRNEYRIHS